MKRMCYVLAAVLTAAAIAANCANANEPPEETKVVYPASATSRTPIAVGPTRSALPPVKEGNEFDVETPLGQIAAVQAALDSIQAAQLELERELADAVERVDSKLAELGSSSPQDRADKPRLIDVCVAIMALVALVKALLPDGIGGRALPERR